MPAFARAYPEPGEFSPQAVAKSLGGLLFIEVVDLAAVVSLEAQDQFVQEAQDLDGRSVRQRRQVGGYQRQRADAMEGVDMSMSFINAGLRAPGRGRRCAEDLEVQLLVEQRASPHDRMKIIAPRSSTSAYAMGSSL